MNSSNEIKVIQEHNGSGDNVAGDKVIQQSVSIDAIREPILEIVKACRYRKYKDAKNKLELLKKTSNLSSDAVQAARIIEVYVEIISGESRPEYIQELNSTITTTSSVLLKDIALAAVVFLLADKDKNEAIARFEYEDSIAGAIANEVFYEKISELEGLLLIFKENKYSLSEGELCGLVRGAIRLGSSSNAIELSTHLYANFSNLNSRVLVALAKTLAFDDAIEQRHFWSISAGLYESLIELCDEFAVLLHESEAKDTRVVTQAARLFQYTFATYQPLVDACWKYISQFSELVPEVASQLRNIFEKEPYKRDQNSSRFLKANDDPSYRRELLLEIFSSRKVTIEDVAIMKNYGDTSEIKRWIEDDGTVEGVDKIQHEFSILELTVHSCLDHPKDIDNIRQLVNTFISTYESNLKNLYPPIIVELSDKLAELGLSDIAADLLRPLIPECDLWLSPLTRCYLNALLESHQFATLNNTLNEVKGSDKDEFTLQVKARQYDNVCKYEDAINATLSAIELNPLSLYSWKLLVLLHKRNNSDDNRLAYELDRIPNEIFSRPTDSGYQLLAEISRLGGFKKVEPILLSWFISDPDFNARNISNFSINEILMANAHEEYSLSVGKCLGAVCYTSDGEMHTKLLVSDDTPHHHCLIRVSTALGKLLIGMDVGAVRVEAMRDIKLLERIPPFIAAFRIASDLRQMLNDGTDCFYSVKVPDDPEEAIEGLKRKLGYLKEGESPIESQLGIPLFVKGFHKTNYDVVKSALYHLTSSTSIKHALPAFGTEQPNTIIIDVYSAAYMAITGLMYQLFDNCSKVLITRETKYYIEDWLSSVSKEDYLTIDVDSDGFFVRTTFEDMVRQTGNIQESLRHLLANANIEAPNLVDLPPHILRISDLVDPSVLSSFKLAISNDIPWCCIDLTFAQLAHADSYKIINVFQLVCLLSSDLELEDKLNAYSLYAYSDLPFPIYYNDLLGLSVESDEQKLYLLAELLRKTASPSDKIDKYCEFLSLVLSKVLANAYLDGEILNGLRVSNVKNNGLAERIFNVCCSSLITFEVDLEAEQKLSILLAKLIYTFRQVSTLNRLVRILAYRFISGHFMNVDAVNNHLKELLNSFDE